MQKILYKCRKVQITKRARKNRTQKKKHILYVQDVLSMMKYYLEYFVYGLLGLLAVDGEGDLLAAIRLR